MSEEQKENSKEPAAASSQDKAESELTSVQAAAPKAPAGASPDTAAKVPVSPQTPEPDQPAAIPAGPFGKRLENAGLSLKHLGQDAWGNETVDVARESLLQAGEILKSECDFDLLMSCTGVDWKDRLESVYHLYSTKTHQYFVIKVTADESAHSPSLMPIWPSADWHERESFDLLGIQYDGHTNLTRILMPVDWLGHPLRKDYKVDDPRLVWNQR